MTFHIRGLAALAFAPFATPLCLAQSSASASSPRANPALRETILYSTRGDNRLHILDAKDLSLIASHDIGLGAHELVVSPEGRWVIGTAYGGPGPGHQPADDRVAVFDLSTGKLHRTIDLELLSRPNDAAFLDANTVYLTVEVPPKILRLNVETGEHKAIDVEHKANHMLALSPDAKRLYVSHVVPGRVTVIDTSTDTIISRIDVPAGAEGLAVTTDNSRVWVGCNRSDQIAIVDPVAGKVEKTIPCPGFPLRLRASPNSKYMAASCPKSHELAIFEVANPDKARRVSMRDAAKGEAAPNLQPTSIFFTADGTRLAVVVAGQEAEIVVVDVASGVVSARRMADGPVADALVVARVAASSVKVTVPAEPHP
jgi:DNA-binding beta-propeller fold protein YncE